jgi:hypothetical protein
LDYDEENERLKNLLKEKEEEISNIEKLKTGDESYFNKIIHNLKLENESLQGSLEKCNSCLLIKVDISQNTLIEREIENLRNSVSYLKNEVKEITTDSGNLKSEIFQKNEQVV